MRGLAIFALASVLACESIRAEHVLPSPSFEAGSGVEMRITNYYETIPPTGLLPLRVEVKNLSEMRRVWRIRTIHSQFGLRSMQFVTSLAVDAHTERTFELLVPVAPGSLTISRYSTLAIEISGYGVVNGTTSEHASSSGLSPSPFLGMGEALAVNQWGPLRERMEKTHSRALDGSAVDPALLPEDWRGLAGFEIMVFADFEWRQIRGPQRNAIEDWVIQGGKLVLMRASGAEASDLPAVGELGIGEVIHWLPTDSFQDSVVQLLLTKDLPGAGSPLQNYTWQWPLALSLGRPEPPALLIISFMVSFALVIGPLNFLAFAPQGHRHRLFWTTPAIALAASVIMGMFITLSEGFGGKGDRFDVLLNLPHLRKSAVWQEQVSRTGVLTSGAFMLSEPSLILPIALRDTPGGYALSERGRRYLLDGATWSGDWFRSRTTQAQLFAAVRPTRSQVQLVTSPDGVPSAVSFFEDELPELWYFDDHDVAWRGEKIRPGEKQPLHRAEPQAFALWWKDVLKPAGFVTRHRAQAFAKDRKGKFFASTVKPRPIASLKVIRWKDFGGLIMGRASP
ncbi:MAG TPA: hypothetical protein VIS99_01875 [Terrimicrobiaceae bacterium]